MLYANFMEGYGERKCHKPQGTQPGQKSSEVYIFDKFTYNFMSY